MAKPRYRASQSPTNAALWPPSVASVYVPAGAVHPPEHQGGVGEGDDDVGVKLVADLWQEGWRTPDTSGAGQGRALHCPSLPASMHAQDMIQAAVAAARSARPRLTAFLMVHTAVGLPGSGDTAISAAGAGKCRAGEEESRPLVRVAADGDKSQTCADSSSSVSRAAAEAGRCHTPVTARPGRSTRSVERAPRPQAA